MGDVIEVNFEAARLKRAQQVSEAHNNQVRMNEAQACMFKLMEMRLSPSELTEVCAALEDYDCYMQSCEHTQMLVDIYQMLEAF